MNEEYTAKDERIPTDLVEMQLAPKSSIDIVSLLGPLVKQAKVKVDIEHDVCRSALFNSENVMIDMI